jgi:uncharacterized membrane protein
VLFLMLSNHYPLAFGTEFNWIIASLVFIIGVLIRHYFNTMHMRKGNPTTGPGSSRRPLFVVIMWLSTVPKVLTGENRRSRPRPRPSSPRRISLQGARHGSRALRHVPRPSRATKASIMRRKAWCWKPTTQIALHAREIYLQAGRSHAMPPANVTQITPEERALLVAWYERRASSVRPTD